MAYVAMGGKEGVIGIGSGKVTSGGGGNVSVAAGAFAIENTYPGGEQQMYVGREVSSSLVAVPPTSGVARSDMLVVYIDDPQFGGAIPSDVTVGPYIKYGLISNVGSTATAVPGSYPRPALALARIDLPVSTSTITDGMITDLRGAQGVAGTAQYKKVSRSFTPAADVAGPTAVTADVVWPYAAGWDIDVPSWASKISARATLVSIRGDAHATLDHYGKLWIVVSGATTITGQQIKYEVPASSVGQMRHQLIAGFADVVVPAALRGTKPNFKIHLAKDGNASNDKSLIATTVSTVLLDVEFFEEPA
jgi:hypothetical protein